MPHKCKCDEGIYVPQGHPYERQFRCSACGRWRTDSIISANHPTGISYAREKLRYEKLLDSVTDEKQMIALAKRIKQLKHKIKTIANTCANHLCKDNHYQLKDKRMEQRLQVQPTSTTAMIAQQKPILKVTSRFPGSMPDFKPSKQGMHRTTLITDEKTDRLTQKELISKVISENNARIKREVKEKAAALMAKLDKELAPKLAEAKGPQPDDNLFDVLKGKKL